MKKFISFPKIVQFRQIIKNVTDNVRYSGNDENGEPIYNYLPLPTLTFEGTVKLHGTNAGVSINREGELWAQSRENVISIEKDNAGFAFFTDSNKKVFISLFEKIDMKDADFLTIFGEWCGGNIQKGVAINGLPKMFVVFAVKLSYNTDPLDVNDKRNSYLKSEDFKHIKSIENRIFNIQDFKTFSIDIDFEKPSLVQNKLIEITSEIEKQCPVGLSFGNDGIGEGVVWKHYNEDDSIIQFKVKGEKHSSSKVKKLQIVDIEKINSIQEFVDYVVTEERLNQGIEKTFTMKGEEINIKKMSDFLKWIMSDIIEEEMDTIIDNNLEPKDISKFVSNVARKWFLEKWNKI